jgi:hypothetical protein
MPSNEKRALNLIERAKEELNLEEEIASSDWESPQTPSEWMAWLIDHAVADLRLCVQQEISLKWVYDAMRLIEHLEILGIAPTMDKRFWEHFAEFLIPQEGKQTIIILQPRQEKREDAFWYSGEVARIERYVLFAIEEVTCRFKEEGNPDGSDMFHDEEAREEASSRNLTDADLIKDIHWYRNNWFEIRDRREDQIIGSTLGSWTEGMNALLDLASQGKDSNDI